MSSKWKVCILALIIINAVQSITFECIGSEQCKSNQLTCNPNENCNVICHGYAACLDITIYANTATNLHIDCEKSES